MYLCEGTFLSNLCEGTFLTHLCGGTVLPHSLSNLVPGTSQAIDLTLCWVRPRQALVSPVVLPLGSVATAHRRPPGTLFGVCVKGIRAERGE